MMSFLDDLRETVNAPVEKTEKHIKPDNKQKLNALKEEIYNRAVQSGITDVKRSLHSAVEAYRNSNSSSEKKTFIASTKISMKKSIEIMIPHEFEISAANSLNNDNFYACYKYCDDYGADRYYLHLKEIYSVDIKRVSYFFFSEITARVTLTPLGKRYFEDLRKSCANEGIIITRIYAKCNDGSEFELGQTQKINDTNCEVWIDSKVDL